VPERFAVLVRPLMLAAGLTLFAVLFLDWREASIETASVVVHAGTSGWAGWGIVAGALLVSYVVLELRTARPVLVPATALLAAAFTAVEFFTGSAEVSVAGVVAVDTQTRSWPAFVGLALAVLLAAGGVLRLLAAARTLVGEPGARPTSGTA
jgi:hypothetical protein